MTDKETRKPEFEPLQIMGIFWLVFGIVILVATFFVTGKDPMPLVKIISPADGSQFVKGSDISLVCQIRSFNPMDSIRVGHTFILIQDTTYIRQVAPDVFELNFLMEKLDTNVVTISVADRSGAVGYNALNMKYKNNLGTIHLVKPDVEIMNPEQAQVYRSGYVGKFRSHGRLANIIAGILLSGAGVVCLIRGTRRKRKRLTS
ncbi:MAG: hypothetical protein ONB05_08015 [candidate division KSB1 bacterium]|nr:hypothetical protein [candidate division KSB1 bacterium]